MKYKNSKDFTGRWLLNSRNWISQNEFQECCSSDQKRLRLSTGLVKLELRQLPCRSEREPVCKWSWTRRNSTKRGRDRNEVSVTSFEAPTAGHARFGLLMFLRATKLPFCWSQFGCGLLSVVTEKALMQFLRARQVQPLHFLTRLKFGEVKRLA